VSAEAAGDDSWMHDARALDAVLVPIDWSLLPDGAEAPRT